VKDFGDVSIQPVLDERCSILGKTLMSGRGDTTSQTDNAGVYFQHQRYWNALPQVIKYMNVNSSGDETIDWIRNVGIERGRPFERALFLNCGTGWVDRAFIEAGVARCGVGVDISPSMIDTAKGLADDANLPLSYLLADGNNDPLPLDGVDLVVNHAACHHLTHLDRVLGQIADALPDDGWFVSFDYVGAHRNQYPADQWEAAILLNDRLPVNLQSSMQYPHLPTMLAMDPSEAVHSELFLKTHDRYFSTVSDRPIGGWLAYLVLTDNQQLFDNLGDEANHWIDKVIAADRAVLDADPAKTLFAFRIAQPRRPSAGIEIRSEWRRTEDLREETASKSGGVYYPRTMPARYAEAAERSRLELLERTDPATAIAHSSTKALVRHLIGRIPGAHSLRQLVRTALRHDTSSE
jgi:SAM-dependent methyltransferase